MLCRTVFGTRRHAVEFRVTRSPRDLLMSLPVRLMDGDVPPAPMLREPNPS
jgi:hypothetical protein